MPATPRQIDKDKDAVWVVNLSNFRFPHGTREGVVFEPKQPTRVLMDEWIEGQGELMQVVEDPFGPMPESPVIEPTPLRDVKTGEPVTGVGTGPEGTGNADDMRKSKPAKK